MAACFSSSGISSISPVYVLSKISRLAEFLLAPQSMSLPGILIKSLIIPDSFGNDPVVTDEYVKVLQKVEIVICDPHLLVKTYKYMPNLKWAHSTFAGVETVLKAIPQQPSFTLTRHASEGFNSLIAEYVVCQILNCERLSKLCWKNQELKIWGSGLLFNNYRSLDELTVGILGVGNMGSGIAHFLKSRKTTVYGFARMPRPLNSCPNFDGIFTNLEDILPRCDYLCNTLPSTPLTSGILNNSLLEKCQKKPVFINVGRGNIISEEELVKALRNKWLSGAVLDVFETEPLPESSELWNMPEVVITPHFSAISKPEHVAEGFYDNITRYIDGHGLQNIVNWSVGY